MLRLVFQEVISGAVTVENLDRLKGRELIAVALILGTGHSGGKARVKNRILASWQVRTALSKFAKDDKAEIEPIVEAFQRRDLWFFCKSVKIWRSGNKRQLAACLLSWRARARQSGKDRRMEALLIAGFEPYQRMLKL